MGFVYYAFNLTDRHEILDRHSQASRKKSRAYFTTITFIDFAYIISQNTDQ